MDHVIVNNPIALVLKAQRKADLDAIYDAYTEYTHISVRVRDNAGNLYQYDRGYAPTFASNFASTSKLVNKVVVLHQETKGRLQRSDLLSNIIDGFDTTHGFTLDHVLNFGSGFNIGTAMSEYISGADAGDFSVYENTIKNYPLTQTLSAAPGTVDSFKYSNASLSMAGLAAMYAARWDGTQVVTATGPTDARPLPTWQQLVDEFIADTGLLTGITFLRSGILSNISDLTATAYLDLLTALRDRTILNTSILDDMFGATIIDASDGSDGGYPNWNIENQDLRYKKGFWQWQDNTGTWNPSTSVTQFTTIGNIGDNTWIDPDFTYVNLPIQDGGGFVAGRGVNAKGQIFLMKDNEAAIRSWANAIL